MFHTRTGSLVTLSNTNKTAQRNHPAQEFNNGVVLSAEPLKPNQLFEVKIDRKISSWSGSIEIGVTTCDPVNLNFPTSATGFREGTWIMSGNTILMDGHTVQEEYGQDLDTLNEGDRVGVLRTQSGALHFYVNGEDQGVSVTGIPEKVYAVIDMYGKCCQVSICADNNPLVTVATSVVAATGKRRLYDDTKLSMKKRPILKNRDRMCHCKNVRDGNCQGTCDAPNERSSLEEGEIDDSVAKDWMFLPTPRLYPPLNMLSTDLPTAHSRPSFPKELQHYYVNRKAQRDWTLALSERYEESKALLRRDYLQQLLDKGVAPTLYMGAGTLPKYLLPLTPEMGNLCRAQGMERARLAIKFLDEEGDRLHQAWKQSMLRVKSIYIREKDPNFEKAEEMLELTLTTMGRYIRERKQEKFLYEKELKASPTNLHSLGELLCRLEDKRVSRLRTALNQVKSKSTTNKRELSPSRTQDLPNKKLAQGRPSQPEMTPSSQSRTKDLPNKEPEQRRQSQPEMTPPSQSRTQDLPNKKPEQRRRSQPEMTPSSQSRSKDLPNKKSEQRRQSQQMTPPSQAKPQKDENKQNNKRGSCGSCGFIYDNKNRRFQVWACSACDDYSICKKCYEGRMHNRHRQKMSLKLLKDFKKHALW